MHLLYDLYCTQPSRSAVHGGGVYGQNLFLNLLQHRGEVDDSWSLSVLLHPEKPIPHEITSELVKAKIETIPCRSPSEVVAVLERNNYDRFYSPLPNYLISAVPSTMDLSKFVITLHGLREIEEDIDWDHLNYQPVLWKRIVLFFMLPIAKFETISRRKKYKNFLAKNPSIITVSRHSMFSFLTEIPFMKKENVSVFYPLDT